MHIANYCGPLTFIEVIICGMPHVTQVLKLFLKFAVFYAKHIHVLANWPLLGRLHRIFDHFQRFLRMFSKLKPCDTIMGIYILMWPLHNTINVHCCIPFVCVTLTLGSSCPNLLAVGYIDYNENIFVNLMDLTWTPNTVSNT